MYYRSLRGHFFLDREIGKGGNPTSSDLSLLVTCRKGMEERWALSSPITEVRWRETAYFEWLHSFVNERGKGRRFNEG